jgi:ribosome-binding ATPase YchF (GTP1/OBG family)
MQSVSKRLQSLVSEIKKGSKLAVIENSALEKIKKNLEEGKLAQTAHLDEFELVEAKKLCLLTMKPILYVLNKKSGLNHSSTNDRPNILSEQNVLGSGNLDELGDERWIKLMNFFKETNSNYVIVDAGIENELKDFEGVEKTEMRQALQTEVNHGSLGKDGIDDLIKAGYNILGLITYFTTGEDETRAWTIKNGWTAPLAGTAIHMDFKDKFVRAEIIPWQKLLDSGSYSNAREKGYIRTEGKDYVVKDGDVIEFKI